MTTEDPGDFREENSELYEHFRIEVDPGQALTRIDKFLFNRIQNASRNKIQTAAKAGNVLVNEEAVKSNYKIRPGDVISIVMSHPPRDVEIAPEDIPLLIHYEDDDVIIVNKQAGLVVHPGHGNFTGTLLHGLANHFKNSGQTNIDNGFGYLVHRIDKDTSGLLLVAKNEETQTKLAKQFFDHTIDRTYEALVWGEPKEEEGTIEGSIARNPHDRTQMTVFPENEKGKEAITHYKILRKFGYVSLLQCILETGRTHQIRAHLKYIGHPLFNDQKYGGHQILKGTTFTKYKQFVQNCFKIIPRQALHARSIGFIHPKTGKKLSFTSELPDDMKEVLAKWEHYTVHKQMEEEG
ncbi:MAG: RluA family pseudouridine synthase [Bacteroidales bacterium]|jgi:23S rRNA pseudouridine1911/1915/1917 synthase|nr:RluA family pseudouridine synthase [Bacteroidales bacterium]